MRNKENRKKDGIDPRKLSPRMRRLYDYIDLFEKIADLIAKQQIKAEKRKIKKLRRKKLLGKIDRTTGCEKPEKLKKLKPLKKLKKAKRYKLAKLK